MKRMMWLILSVLTVLTMAMVGCAPATTVAPTEPATRVAATEPAPTVAPTEPPTEVPTKMPAGPRYGGTLVIADIGEPSSLCFVDAYLSGFQKLSSLYDSLIRWDQDEGRFIPWLATSWEQESDTTWVFHLREGVQFHRGYGELTAEDVAFSTNVIVENSLPSMWLMEGIDHVEVVDRYTVRCHLEHPHAPFLFLGVDRIGVLSKAAYEELGREEFDRNPVGSGPFQFGEWVSGDHLTLRRFEDYWQEGVPYLDEIEFRFVPEAVSRFSLITAGQVDMAFDPDFKDVDQMDDPNINVLEVPGFNWDALLLNSALPPLDSREVRQAIGYAIDREVLVEGIYFGHGTPDDDPLPEGFLGADPDQQLYPNTADPDKARQLLAAAGYPDGFAITLMIRDRESDVQMAQIVAEQLAVVGITVDIQRVDSSTWFDAVVGSGTDMPCHMTISSIRLAAPDPDATMYWFHHSSSRNWHGWDNPEVDPLLEEGRRVQGFDERIAIYRSLVDLILEDAPYVYMMNHNLVAATLADVHGFELSPLSTQRDYSHTWLDR